MDNLGSDIVKSLIWGLISVLICGAIYFIVKDIDIVIKILAVLGVVSWGISGIILGVFSGNYYRITYTEKKSDRESRINTSTIFFLFGLPNIIAVVIISYIKYKY